MGRPLARGGRYSWRVRVWDEDQQVSAWSEPARFEVELDPADRLARGLDRVGPIREDFRPPSGDGLADPVATP